ncbi:MAG: metallophosphoesterase [Deltaproteobacteria bacterium]|nr:metallophosphoesterase [Deltaproteobacteria bacterium]
MKIACVSDIHLSDPVGDYLAHEWFRELFDLLDSDHLIVAGDVVSTYGRPSTREDFALFRKTLTRFGWNDGRFTTVVPGNHDTKFMGAAWHDEDPEQFYRRFPKLFANAKGVGYFPFYKLFPEVAIIGLDSTSPSLLRLERGELGEDQLEALDRTLRLRSVSSRKVIISMHHPPNVDHGLVDADAFWEVLESHRVDLIVSGHLHESFVDEDSYEIPVACCGGFMHDDGDVLMIETGPRGLKTSWWNPWE